MNIRIHKYHFKNKVGCISLLFSALFFWQCSNATPELLSPPGGRTFWALKLERSGSSINEAGSYQVPAVFMGQNAYVAAYVEAKNPVSDAHVQALLDAFANSIGPVEHSVFGQPLGINTDKRAILLLLDIDDGYNGNNGYIAGYFDPRNSFKDSSVQASGSTRSNEAEMLYLDTYPSRPGTSDFQATAAHEYQHLLQFAKNYRNNTEELTWVDEGLSEVASDITGFGPQSSRLETFSQAPPRATMQGNSLIKWGSDVRDYAHSYIYFRHLADVYGNQILTRIFNESTSGHAGVGKALSEVDSSGNFCSGGTYSHFECSYRNMWAAILKLDDFTTSARGATTANLSGAFPSNRAFTTITPNPYKPANSSNFTIGEMGFVTFSKSVGSTVNLSSATSSLTLLQKSSSDFYVVFNHQTTGGSSTSTGITASLAGDPEEPTQNHSNETSGGSFSIMQNNELGQKIHWRYNMPREDMYDMPLAEPGHNSP